MENRIDRSGYNFTSLTHAVRGQSRRSEGGEIGSFHHVPINLIGAVVLSAVQYLSGRQILAALLDFGGIAPG